MRRRAATPGPITIKCRHCGNWGGPHLDCIDKARAGELALEPTPEGRPWQAAGDRDFEWDQMLSAWKEWRSGRRNR